MIKAIFDLGVLLFACLMIAFSSYALGMLHNRTYPYKETDVTD